MCGGDTWRHNFGPLASGKQAVIGVIPAPPAPADPNIPTPDETKERNAWRLRAARTYAEIALQVKDEYGESISMVNNLMTLDLYSKGALVLAIAHPCAHVP